MSKTNRATDRAERAAAAMREREAQERRRRNLMVGAVVLVLLVIVAGGYFLSRALDTSNNVKAPAAGSQSSKYGLTVGPASAPHNIVIYEDFLCPYCGELERASRDDLSRLTSEGKVQVEYRPFDLLSRISDYSARSAAAFSVVLDKSGPQVAKKFHDLLYENQPEETGPFPDNEQLVKLAVQAGAKESDVRGPIENFEGKQWVTDATQAAMDAGVRGTPTVLLDGKVFQDGRTMDELAQNLVDKVS
jgi:protein-disulfide isomerase